MVDSKTKNTKFRKVSVKNKMLQVQWTLSWAEKGVRDWSWLLTEM